MTEHKPWLSVPDEDPPERGLAELMAAARMKAEVMARPPWWRRMFDVLRRPPVLALATIVVLLGGVIVVGRHPDDVQTAAPAREQAPAVHAESPPPAAVSADPSSGAISPPVAPPPAVAPPPVVAPKHLATKAPARKSEPRPVAETKPDAPTNAQAKTGDRDALERAVPQAPSDVEATDDAPVQKGTLAGAPQKTVDPLARCRAAAAKKDCAGAKTCVQKLPATERANASRDAALKSCL